TGIDGLSLYWVNQNMCNITPVITTIPNSNTSDNSTATRYLYSGGMNGNTVELFTVEGGGHSWPGSPLPSSSVVTCLDFDASKEIWRFFSQYDLSATNATTNLIANNELIIYPNPAYSELNIHSSNVVENKTFTITDASGKVILNGLFGDSNDITIDISHLAIG